MPTTSTFICNLKEGTEVVVTTKVGRRAYLKTPVQGWCSLAKVNGERILDSIDEENNLIKKNIQLATPQKTAVSSRSRHRPKQMAQKFENRIDQFRQRLVLADGEFDAEKIQYVGVLSAEVSSLNQRNAVISLMIISYETKEVVLEETECVNITEPLVVGHAEFTQALACVKFYEEYLSTLSNRKFVPQVLFIAAAGILNPKRFGLACHIGLRLQVPTIGVESRLSKAPGIDTDEIAKQIQQLDSGTIEIKNYSDESLGAAVKMSSEEVYYVSPGDSISASSACSLFQANHATLPLTAAKTNVSRVLGAVEEKSRMLKKLRQSPGASPQSPEFR